MPPPAAALPSSNSGGGSASGMKGLLKATVLSVYDLPVEIGAFGRYDIERSDESYWLGTNRGLVELTINGNELKYELMNDKNTLLNNHVFFIWSCYMIYRYCQESEATCLYLKYNVEKYIILYIL